MNIKTTGKAWWASLSKLAANPLSYVVGFALIGSACVVCGIGVLAGAGWALVATGTFLLAAAVFITKGMTPNV